MKFNCIIIDDEPLAAEILEEYLGSVETVQHAGTFYNANTASNYLNNHKTDIIFLDIQMPVTDGLSFLKSLPEKPVTIITTAYRDYSLDGFDLGVMDYLLKPIKFERFFASVKRAVEFLELKKLNQDLIAANNRQEITIKSGTRKIILPIADILFIQGLKDYAIVHTTDAKKFVIKGYIKAVEQIMPAGLFIRVHRSFIVAKDKIRIINRGKIETANHQIPIGRTFKEQVDQLINSR